jgi:hypothetical protein
MNIRQCSTLYFLHLFGLSYGYWVKPRYNVAHPSFLAATMDLRMTFNSNNEISQSNELLSGDDPCWQNMLDDDCSMGNIYAANFVASKWIQSMPCGEGIEVSKTAISKCRFEARSKIFICYFSIHVTGLRHASRPFLSRLKT